MGALELQDSSDGAPLQPELFRQLPFHILSEGILRLGSSLRKLPVCFVVLPLTQEELTLGIIDQHAHIGPEGELL
jgi:hypothetical protein